MLLFTFLSSQRSKTAWPPRPRLPGVALSLTFVVLSKVSPQGGSHVTLTSPCVSYFRFLKPDSELGKDTAVNLRESSGSSTCILGLRKYHL